MTFASLDELADLLASSQKVQRCLPKQWMRYALGRLEQDGQVDRLGLTQSYQDRCSIEQVLGDLQEHDFAIDRLPLAFVRSDAFRYIRPEEGP